MINEPKPELVWVLISIHQVQCVSLTPETRSRRYCSEPYSVLSVHQTVPDLTGFCRSSLFSVGCHPGPHWSLLVLHHIQSLLVFISLWLLTDLVPSGIWAGLCWCQLVISVLWVCVCWSALVFTGFWPDLCRPTLLTGFWTGSFWSLTHFSLVCAGLGPSH